MKAYAGIGSRETPLHICQMMTHAATWLEEAGWILRSGGAEGADTAFFYGTNKKEIYIPWKGFIGNYDAAIDIADLPEEIVLTARTIASQYHPAWVKLTPQVRQLMTRNVFQMFGRDFKNPSKFVICWTPNGSCSGGTGQAIRIAKGNNIPVFDLGRPDIEKVQEDCFNFVNSFKEKISGSA